MAANFGPFGLPQEYWSYKRLLREVLVDQDTIIEWCKSNGLLAQSQQCCACNIPMHWETFDRGIDRYRYDYLYVIDMQEIYMNVINSYRWRCPNKHCRKAKSIRHDSWFSTSHLSLEQILELTFLWTEDMSGETVRKLVGVNKNTVVDWFNFCRDLCARYMDEHNEKIGGVGKVVEIDEAKFGKRKYNRGRRREGHWVLGGVERGSDKEFMQIVPSRDAATLLPIIIANVEPGTEIHTDR